MPESEMNPKHSKIPIQIRSVAGATCLAFLAGCATTPQTARGPQYPPAANSLREARSSHVPIESRAYDYLQVAAICASLLGTGTQDTPARITYNSAEA